MNDRILATCFLAVAGLGQGLVVGSGLAALITVLDLVPRLLQLTKGTHLINLMERVLIAGALTGSVVYFSPPHGSWGSPAVVLLGFAAGTFIGLLAAALAEVLNVLPVLARRVGWLERIDLLVAAIIMGKVLGSLYQWLVLNR